MTTRHGEPDRAIQLATQVPDGAGLVPPFWESGHRLHLAAACADLERWGDVVEHLAAAQRLAPQWSQVQPLDHTVVGQLVEHRGRRSEHISELATHYGAGLLSADLSCPRTPRTRRSERPKR